MISGNNMEIASSALCHNLSLLPMVCIRLCVCLFVCVSVNSSVCVYLFVCVSVYSSVCLFIRQSHSVPTKMIPYCIWMPSGVLITMEAGRVKNYNCYIVSPPLSTNWINSQLRRRKSWASFGCGGWWCRRRHSASALPFPLSALNFLRKRLQPKSFANR